VTIGGVDRRRVLGAGTGLAAAAWLAGCDSGGGAGGKSSGTAAGATAGATATATPVRRTPATAKPSGPADWTALGHSLHGRLIRPGDAAYPTARLLYNERFDALRPAAVAYVANSADVKECLAFARRAGVPVSIRSGGHSYAGWSSGTGHLVIDVSSLATVAVDGSSATVGAGARLIDVYTGLAAHGRTLPAGSCPTVGVAGLTLGGGHGVISRAYGLTCDSLTGADIVTADGRLLHTSASEHPDLFWALRGAGNGQFGVVTALRFTTRRSPSCTTGYLTWPWSKAAAVLRAWQSWGPGQPDEIWSSLHLDASAGGSPRVSLAALTLGTHGDLADALDRLADSAGAPASSVSLHDHTYLDATLSYAGCSAYTTAQCHLPGSVPGRTAAGRLSRDSYTARSDFYDKPLNAAGISTLLAHAAAVHSGAGSVALTALGGAVNRVAPTATAFTHRRSLFLAQYLTSPGSDSAWLDGLWSAMRRWASGAAYQNYTDPRLTDWRSAYYGPAAARLATVKHTYDPDRLFTFPQAL
jgi:FAD/FMN-containing dehydrogenase